MALKSYYSTGTATVAAGSKAVTGQGTAWSLTLQPGDLFGTHKGLPVRIETVNSDTSLTLAYVWPGAAQTAAPYEVQIVSDAERVTATARDLLVALANGNLASISDLESAADTVPYFTGLGTAGLLMLGPTTISGVTDYETIDQTGLYASTGASNAPDDGTADGFWMVRASVFSPQYQTQTAWRFDASLGGVYDGSDTRLFRRHKIAGGWRPWYRCRLAEAEQQALWDARYLGINGQAADSAKLGGQLPAYYWSNGNSSFDATDPGYEVLPNGMIRQFGTSPTGSDIAITFPIAFPNDVISIVATSSFAVSATALVVAHCSGATTTGFTMKKRAIVGSGNPQAEITQCYWQAIGR